MDAAVRQGTVSVQDEDGNATLSMSVAAYWELMAATEKYIQLLKETSKGFVTADEFGAVDELIYKTGLVFGNEQASLRITKRHLYVSTATAAKKIPLQGLRKAEGSAGAERYAIQLSFERHGTVQVEASSATIGSAVVKALKLKRDALQQPPAQAAPAGGGRASPRPSGTTTSPPPPDPLDGTAAVPPPPLAAQLRDSADSLQCSPERPPQAGGSRGAGRTSPPPPGGEGTRKGKGEVQRSSPRSPTPRELSVSPVSSLSDGVEQQQQPPAGAQPARSGTAPGGRQSSTSQPRVRASSSGGGDGAVPAASGRVYAKQHRGPRNDTSLDIVPVADFATSRTPRQPARLDAVPHHVGNGDGLGGVRGTLSYGTPPSQGDLRETHPPPQQQWAPPTGSEPHLRHSSHSPPSASAQGWAEWDAQPRRKSLPDLLADAAAAASAPHTGRRSPTVTPSRSRHPAAAAASAPHAPPPEPHHAGQHATSRRTSPGHQAEHPRLSAAPPPSTASSIFPAAGIGPVVGSLPAVAGGGGERTPPPPHAAAAPTSAASAQESPSSSPAYIPVTRNITDVGELEGVALLVCNLSPHAHPLGVDMMSHRAEATVVPIGGTMAASGGDSGSVSIHASVPHAGAGRGGAPGGGVPIVGLDPRPNRASKQSLRLVWDDDNARALLGCANAAPYLVRVVADFSASSDVVSVLPADPRVVARSVPQDRRDKGSPNLSATGVTPMWGAPGGGGAAPPSVFEVSLLPGESVDFVQATSTGASSGSEVCALQVAFVPLSLQQQLEYVMPLAESRTEVPNFSLQKLLSEYRFAEEAAVAYAKRRLENELHLVKAISQQCGGDLPSVITLGSEEGISYVDVDFIETMISELPAAVLKRPQHYLPVYREPAVMVGSPHPSTDIQSKRLCHKWWIAAARALAEDESLVSRCFTDYDVPMGHFTVRVCTSGWWMDITCDTWVPCDRNGPLFASSPSNELWVPFLEKVSAWLAGGYQSLAYGTVGRALALFTGAPYHRIFLGQPSLDAQALWDEIAAWVQQRCILCVTAEGVEPVDGEASGVHTPGGDSPGTGNPRAAATVLSAVVYEGRHLFRLRGDRLPGNLPWGWEDTVWRSHAQNSRLSAEVEIYAKLFEGGSAFGAQATPEEDRKGGVFWMELPDFMGVYAALTVCHLRAGWSDTRIHGEFQGGHCDFVVEVHPEKTTQTVIQLQPAAPGASPTLGLMVLKKHADAHTAYEPVALVPSAGTPAAGPDDPPVAVELTLQGGAEYVLVPCRVDPSAEATQFVLSLHTQEGDAGWAYLRSVSRQEVGELFCAPICRQGRGQDAKPVPNSRQSTTAVWWRDDTAIACGMVLENCSSSWTWKCEVDSESGPTRVSLPPRSKMHVFPDLTGDRPLLYDHFVSIYHTSSYAESAVVSNGTGPFAYSHSITLPTLERPVQKGPSSAIHSWHTLRL